MSDFTEFNEQRREDIRNCADKRVKAILGLKGVIITQIKEYQFRINDTIDLYPLSRKFHDIKTKERGYYPFPFYRLQKFIDSKLVNHFIDDI